MRLTTKIMAGIILSIFILSLVFIVGFSFSERRHKDYTWQNSEISQENIVSVSVQPYSTVVLHSGLRNDENRLYVTGTLHLKPLLTSDNENKLFLPEELKKIIRVESVNDTLKLIPDIDKLYEKYNKYHMLQGFNITLHTNNIDIVNEQSGVITIIENITTDNINVNARGDVNIENCKAIRVNPYMNEWHKIFRIKNSQVSELNLDLDKITNNWFVENCDIEIENLTGGNNHHVQLPKSEAKIMNWIPKGKEARLHVELYGDTARVTF